MFPRMSGSEAWVASDAHLGAAPPAMETAFLGWLEHAAAHAGVIVLNGDLFDFWFEWGTVIPSGHTRVLGLLARIVDAGTPVHLLGGNHDWWGGRYLVEEVGLHFHPEPVRLELGGRSALVAHGDGLGAGDLGYRLLRSVLRSPLSRHAFRWLHPDVGTAIAKRVSRTDSRPSDPSPAHLERARQLERWARDALLEDEGIELVLLGHTHQPVRLEVAPGRFYLNTGDWIRNGTWGVIAPGEPPRLERWTGVPRSGS